jgi:hypothetical protein
MPITAVATMFIRSQGIGIPAALWGFVGLRGIAYAAIVTRRMRAQDAYQPEFEDWLFHVLLPFAAYVTLAVSAYGAPICARLCLASQRRCCCCSSSAFTTPGMPYVPRVCQDQGQQAAKRHRHLYAPSCEVKLCLNHPNPEVKVLAVAVSCQSSNNTRHDSGKKPS